MKYKIQIPKKQVNKNITRLSRVIACKEGKKATVISLTKLQESLGWPLKSCVRVKSVMLDMGFKNVTESYIEVTKARKIVDYIFAN